jgi:carbamoyltransferase
MKILGISAFYHDSAATYTENGEVICAAQEERFTRIKQDSGFPTNAVKFCLEFGGVSVKELDAIVFYDKPLLKMERLLETYYAFAPQGIRSFITAIPVWLKEKLFLKREIYNALAEIEEFDKKKIKLLFPEHHLSHAASAFYPSPYDDAAILTIDGVGEWSTASICHGKGNDITVLKELRFPHSLGLLYSAFTYFLGFKVNSGEYKLMGLAPYGNTGSERVERYKVIVKDKLIKVYEDGSIWLDQSYFNYSTGLRMVRDNKWEELFGFPRREAEDELEQHHCDLGLAIQEITEEVVVKMCHEAKRLTGSKNVVLAGGVALNCVSNGKIQLADVFENVYIQPSAGDAGGSLGAALAANYIYFGNERIVEKDKIDSMSGSYLGPEYSDMDIELMAKKYRAVYKHHVEFSSVAKQTAAYLADENVVGWFQGKMEFGPRALGNRSILGDPRSPEMQKKLNLKIKYRESFRPFAPSVLAEDVQEHFECKTDSPYMLLVHKVNENKRIPYPEGYEGFDLKDKLYYLRSHLPSVTHIDYSARIQSVHKETNPEYYELIKSFKNITGVGVVINTSFNVRGEPIVCTPQDAYKCFMRTEMDYLVIGNYIFDKKEQPNFEDKENWKETFVLD